MIYTNFQATFWLKKQTLISTPTNITVKAGVYVVKIDNYIAKVVVR